ncbi:hypothetical protein R1sor_021055 [Riccia sorocarpa]|uniref:Reverse transcriptase domain-containing protein n=1 Tax=Riccia sorocarpa TaxID=122646 RepID=A0ABD3GK65_9MARC
MLQELRIREFLANCRLNTLAEGKEYIIDFTSEGKADAAVVTLNNNWKTIEKDCKGDLHGWIRVQTEEGILGLASIHGPHDRRARKDLWTWMEEKWPKSDWFFGGDWNSVETYEDNVGKSSIQQGTERRRWQSFLAHQDLFDGWLHATIREGPHFTWQQQVNDRLDQSRLDRIYFSHCERWASQSIKMQHDSTVQLSDYRPVILTIDHPQSLNHRKANYFKTAPEMLQQNEVKTEMQEIWASSGAQGEDPRRNWDWKWSKGVIKLLPKEGDKLAIKKRRPISLLNLGYKVVAKLLTNRLKKVMPDLVHVQQKGFISGRSIIDDIMGFQIGQEWASKSNQRSLFVKLDFEKAYDRADHPYLWKTMHTMGIDPEFIDMTKALVTGATSKVFAMGSFSKEIDLHRWVRQGCPLASLLFSLATQPLILILKHAEKEDKTGAETLRIATIAEWKTAQHSLLQIQELDRESKAVMETAAIITAVVPEENPISALEWTWTKGSKSYKVQAARSTLHALLNQAPAESAKANLIQAAIAELEDSPGSQQESDTAETVINTREETPRKYSTSAAIEQNTTTMSQSPRRSGPSNELQAP